MINSFSKKDFNPIAFKELKKILFDKKSVQNMKLEPLNDTAKKFSGSAPLCGGNLSVLQCSLGTKFELNSKNKILMIEDVGERGYKVDKMLYHLQLSKALSGVKAIIFGDFVSGDEPTGENYIDFALMRFALSTKIPVYKCMDFGHGQTNRPLIFNGSVKTSIKKSILTIDG
jgi:muramoyltetrapeptide carboxypeptidase